MFTKNDIARGVVAGAVVLFSLSGFSARAYSTVPQTSAAPSVSSSSFELKNISLPNFNLPSLNSISNEIPSSGSFSFWGFFSLQNLSNWYQAHGGLQGVVVYVLNVFLVVIQVLGQIVRAVLGFINRL